jgi:hypothetical protein
VRPRRHATRRQAVDGGDDRAHVVGRRAAAAADDVDEAVARELAEQARRVVRLLVVQAHLVRQAGVRVAGDPRRRDLGELLDERAHLARAERAVDADDQRVRVLDRRPERIDRLPGEVAAAPVDGGEGEPERQLGRDVDRRGDRRLRIERVEDRLDQQQVDAALLQRPDLVRVRLAHLVERRGAVRRVVDARRERERDVERADRARDEPVRRLVGDAARDARALEIHLPDDIRVEGVVRLADRRRGEGVRRRDVGAGREVVAMDALDDLRPCDVQQVGVAGDVLRVIPEPVAAVGLLAAHLALDEHAPRPVEDRDSFSEDLLQRFHRLPLVPGSGALSDSLGVC